MSCRCGVDNRTTRPVCRGCKGCVSCGCICPQIAKAVERAKPLGVKCPHCGAMPGAKCMGRVQHARRYEAAGRLVKRTMIDHRTTRRA